MPALVAENGPARLSLQVLQSAARVEQYDLGVSIDTACLEQRGEACCRGAALGRGEDTGRAAHEMDGVTHRIVTHRDGVAARSAERLEDEEVADRARRTQAARVRVRILPRVCHIHACLERADDRCTPGR